MDFFFLNEKKSRLLYEMPAIPRTICFLLLLLLSNEMEICIDSARWIERTTWLSSGMPAIFIGRPWRATKTRKNICDVPIECIFYTEKIYYWEFLSNFPSKLCFCIYSLGLRHQRDVSCVKRDFSGVYFDETSIHSNLSMFLVHEAFASIRYNWLAHFNCIDKIYTKFILFVYLLTQIHFY